MLVFYLIAIGIPISLYALLPKVLGYLSGQRHITSRVPLVAAGVLYFISWFLPSPLINGQDTSFMTHFVGGGLFTGFLWLYTKNYLNWQPKHKILEIITLFATVSALGALNELFELILVEFNLADVLISDTNWDILANSLGALAFYAGYVVFTRTKPKK
ncbi:MAG: hypothetical protein WBP26_03485 [Candidatus Saccharimonadales bacterium]